MPQTMTYPIGAEPISEALFGIPQFERLAIWFSSTSSIQEARKQNKPYKIFEVSMIHLLKSLSSPQKFIEDGFYDENWEIHVYAVPRELKSAAKRLLIDEALPKAKQWCEKPRTEMWKTGRKCFRALFDEKECGILIEQD